MKQLAKVDRCLECPRYKQPFIPPQQVASDIMLVGEQPWRTELEQGAVFVGDSGQLLNQVCSEAGLKRNSLYITNTVKCFSEEKPSKEVVELCSSLFLKKEILDVKPKVVGVLGDYALSALGGVRPISRYRGRVWNIDVGGFKTVMIPTYHPSYLLRKRRMKPLVLADFRLMKQVAEGKPIQKNWFNARILKSFKEIFGYLSFVASSSSIKRVAVDLETDSLDWIGGKVLVVGIAESETDGCGFSVDSLSGNQFHLIKNAIQDLLYKKTVLFHNAKFDLHFLDKVFGIDPMTVRFHDTMALSYVLNEEGDHDLETCATLYGGVSGAYKAGILGLDNKRWKNVEDINRDSLIRYCVADSVACYRVFVGAYKKVCQDLDLKRYYTRLLRPLIASLCLMESWGIKIHKGRLKRLIQTCEDGRDKAVSQIRKLSGIRTLNPASVKQLHEALNKLHIVELEETTSAGAVMEALRNYKKGSVEWKFLDQLLKFRDYAKSYGIAKGFVERLDVDGRIHANFNATRTVTARLSSSDPNLQNIDRSEEWRNIFVAESGWRLISVDYKQIELRLLAHFSNDRVMEADFDSGKDIHGEWARNFFGKQYDIEKEKDSPLAKEMRRFGKTWNFAIPFGGDPESIFRNLKDGMGDDSLIAVDMPMVEKYLKQYFEKYHKLGKWLRTFPYQAERMKVLTSPFGNKRRLFLSKPMNKAELKERYRQALNFLPQSTAAGITNSSLVLLTKKLRELFGSDARIIVQVHDQLLFEVRKSIVKEVVQVIREIMERPIKEMGDRVYPVEIKVGKSWGSLKEI